VVEARSKAAKSAITPASVVTVILPLGAERSRSGPSAPICGGESCAAVLWRAAQLNNRAVMMHFVMVAFRCCRSVGAVVDSTMFFNGCCPRNFWGHVTLIRERQLGEQQARARA
jgi:hypothetical protein